MLTAAGKVVGHAEFATTAAGYARAIEFLTAQGMGPGPGPGPVRRAVRRRLKRAIAREIYRCLTRQIEVPDYADLRPSRQAKNILTAANHLGVWTAAISTLERGPRRDDNPAQHYRTWLATA